MGERQYQQQQQLGLGQDNNNTPRKNNVIQSGVDPNDDGVHHLTKVVSDDTTKPIRQLQNPIKISLVKVLVKKRSLKFNFEYKM